MNKRIIVASAGATAVAATLIFGGVTVANSINADNSTAPAASKDDKGIKKADVNPNTKKQVKTDKFDNVVKNVGEEAGLVDDKTKRSLFSLKVNKITTATSCPSRVKGKTFAPENGIFLIVDIKATMPAKAATAAQVEYMPLIAETFAVEGPDGKLDRTVSSEAAWSCFSDKDLAPAVVNPGQTVTGKIVLDVKSTTGKLVYDPENNGGWSWQY